jgi:hypothetical protein
MATLLSPLVGKAFMSSWLRLSRSKLFFCRFKPSGNLARLEGERVYLELLRRQVSALEETLELDKRGAEKPRLVLLYGMGGVGKSTAVKGLHDDPWVREQFHGAVAYIEITETPSMTSHEQQQRIYRQLTGSAAKFSNPVEGGIELQRVSQAESFSVSPEFSR